MPDHERRPGGIGAGRLYRAGRRDCGPPLATLAAAGAARADAGASLAFVWRSLLKIKHVPQKLGDVTGIPVLFTLLFIYLFGGALAGSAHRYLQFLLPGPLALAVVFVTVYSGVTLNTDLATGAYDRFGPCPSGGPRRSSAH